MDTKRGTLRNSTVFDDDVNIGLWSLWSVDSGQHKEADNDDGCALMLEKGNEIMR